eukprot:56120-Eustigmatos_ZCMA.PRE.1
MQSMSAQLKNVRILTSDADSTTTRLRAALTGAQEDDLWPCFGTLPQIISLQPRWFSAANALPCPSGHHARTDFKRDSILGATFQTYYAAFRLNRAVFVEKPRHGHYTRLR